MKAAASMTKQSAMLVVIVTTACSGSRPGSSSGGDHAEGPTCVKLARRCHAQDGKSELARDCHLFGHSPDATEQQCVARYEQCERECSVPANAEQATHSGAESSDGFARMGSGERSRVHGLPRGCYVMKHRAREEHACFGCVADKCVNENRAEWDYVDQNEARSKGYQCAATSEGCKLDTASAR